VVYVSSQNYTGGFESYYVNVTPMPNIAPNVTLNSPENDSLIWQDSVILNASVFDLNGGDNMTVWFYGDGVVQGVMYDVSDGLVSYTWALLTEGWHYWNVVAGDGSQNTTSETWRFYINLSTPTGEMPEIVIAYPSYASVYGYNESIPLNFSLSGRDLDSCWYSTEGGLMNVSILNCANTTFDVSASGKYDLTVYVNESVEGLTGKASLEFFVDIGKPVIHLLEPEHEYYTNDPTTQFNYVPSFGEAFDYCDLWGDFNGTYMLNQTDNSIGGGSENYFYVYNLSEGNYSWAVSCFGVSGSNSSTGNRTLISDYTLPNVTIDEPTGSYIEGTSIPVDFDVVDDSPTVCYYNLTYSSDGSQLQFRVIEGCQDTTINIDLSPNTYDLEVVAEDAAGNTGGSQTSFSVFTSPGDDGSPGGGGPSSGSGIVLGDPDLRIKELEDIFIERGTSLNFGLDIENTGGKFLNKCHLEFDGEIFGWLVNDQEKGLGVGEKFSFDIGLKVPEDVEPGEYYSSAIVKCDELERSELVNVLVYRNVFEAEILNYEREGNNLIVTFALFEYGGVDKDIKVDYYLVDLDDIVRYSGQEEFFLSAGESSEREIKFNLPKDSFGEFKFKMKLSDGVSEIFIEEDVFLPSQRGLTGLAISDDNKKTLSILGVGVVVLIILIFIVSLVKKVKKRKKKKAILKVKKFRQRGKHKKLMEFEL
ncbi:MAG: hypothetical protein ABIH92_03565, partial [Nanoarchaeota archaeon]